MSAAHLPPAEPPADDVADLLALLQRARICRTDADHTLAHLQDQLGDDNLPAPVRMYFDVERIVAESRLFLWGHTVTALEQAAHAAGLWV